MAHRWRMLAVLFLARLAMAVQFQIVGSLSPLYVETYGVDLAGVGFLIGLYFAPGIALALPGGWIGAWIGDKGAVASGLVLMLLGSALAFLGHGWTAEVAGRVIAGFGAIFLNVTMTKMVVDLFSGAEIATAMAIFVNSWPVGIALALLIMPSIGEAVGLSLATAAVGAFVAMNLVLFVLAWRVPSEEGAGPAGKWPERSALLAVIAAGLVWGLYNAALGMIFGFAPAFLTEHGADIVAAGRITSLVLWLLAALIPLGGVLADRTGRPDTVIVVCFGIMAGGLLGTVATQAATACLLIAGFGAGFGAGPIMSLPARVLDAETRSLGMGVFFTVYYLTMMALPAFAGMLAERSGTAASTFLAGAAFLVLAGLSLVAFRRITRRHAGHAGS